MPRQQRAETEDGLTHTENNQIQDILISFQTGIYTKESAISKIVDLLRERGKMNIRVWEDLKDTVEYNGFSWLEAKQFVSFLKEKYRRKN